MKTLLTILFIAIASQVQIQAQFQAQAPELDYYALADSYVADVPQIDMSGYLNELPSPYRKKTFWDKNKRAFAIVGYQIGTIALGAVGDGLDDSGHKEWGHTLKALEVGALMSGPFIFKMTKRDYLPYVSGYVFMRFALFDNIYNASRGLPGDHIGSVSWYDRMREELNAPPVGWGFAKGLSFVLGVGINFKYF